jgi:hypothetical protein
MNCRYCNSRNVESEETLYYVHGGKPVSDAVQVMCKHCQAEYTVDGEGKILAIYQQPILIVQVVMQADISAEELKFIVDEMFQDGEE